MPVSVKATRLRTVDVTLDAAVRNGWYAWPREVDEASASLVTEIVAAENDG